MNNTMRCENCVKKDINYYSDNLCGWFWLSRILFTSAWAEAENKARIAEYRMRKIEAKLDKRLPPIPPHAYWVIG